MILIITSSLLSFTSKEAIALSSNCVITKVGDAGEPPAPQPGCAGGSDAFIRAAEDIKTAYDVCESGLTFDQPTLAGCLQAELSKAGYDDEHVRNFSVRRGNSLVYHTGPTGSGLCTECLGYVGTVIALWANTSDPNESLNTLPTAGSINDLYAATGFEAGNKHWAPIGSGISAQIQQGDIAVAGSSFNGDHIGIVYTIRDDVSMDLIESNGGYDCRISTTRGPDSPSFKERYTFYRAQ